MQHRGCISTASLFCLTGAMLQVNPNDRPPLTVILAQLQEIGAARGVTMKTPLKIAQESPDRNTDLPRVKQDAQGEVNAILNGLCLLVVHITGMIVNILSLVDLTAVVCFFSHW